MMYILAVSGKEKEGAYAIETDNKKRMVYMFLDKDDAVRYAGLLEADDFPDMSVEVSDQEIIEACVKHGHEYFVVTPDDIVIPPRIE